MLKSYRNCFVNQSWNTFTPEIGNTSIVDLTHLIAYLICLAGKRFIFIVFREALFFRIQLHLTKHCCSISPIKTGKTDRKVGERFAQQQISENLFAILGDFGLNPRAAVILERQYHRIGGRFERALRYRLDRLLNSFISKERINRFAEDSIVRLLSCFQWLCGQNENRRLTEMMGK